MDRIGLSKEGKSQAGPEKEPLLTPPPAAALGREQHSSSGSGTGAFRPGTPLLLTLKEACGPETENCKMPKECKAFHALSAALCCFYHRRSFLGIKVGVV